jgi:hypothetical protein
VNHGPDELGRNLVRCLDHSATLVSGAVGAPVVLALADRRLFGVIALTIRHNSILKIEASVDRGRQPDRGDRAAARNQLWAGSVRGRHQHGVNQVHLCVGSRNASANHRRVVDLEIITHTSHR